MSTITAPKAPKAPKAPAAPDAYPGAIPPDQPTATRIIPPTEPTGPTLQDATDTQPPPADTQPPPEKSGDVPTSQLNVELANLRAEIHLHGKEVLGWFAARGAIGARAINALLGKSVNGSTRQKNRKAALAAILVTSTDAYDATSEPVPNPELWIKLYWLTRLCAAAINIHTVDSARAACVMLTRVDPPTTFGDPETWVVKDAYRSKIDTIVSQVVKGRLDFDGTKALVDQVTGIGDGAAPKAKTQSNVVTAAHASAGRAAKAFIEGKLDAETFFDDLKSILNRLGWTKATNGRAK